MNIEDSLAQTLLRDDAELLTYQLAPKARAQGVAPRADMGIGHQTRGVVDTSAYIPKAGLGHGQAPMRPG